MSKITCLDIELSIMNKFDFRTNLIVPNISNMMGIVAFETDMLVINKNGYATGFEIKTSKSDLKADFRKPQHTKINEFRNGKSGLERYYGKLKYFYYAVPEDLKEEALKLIPDFCGLYCLSKWSEGSMIRSTFLEVKKPKKLFDYQWSLSEKYSVARLGTMRIYNLKRTLNQGKCQTLTATHGLTI
jgi:hypothetical protein